MSKEKQYENAGRPLEKPVGALTFDDLYKFLDDKRMSQHIDIKSGFWHLYRKQTAEFLLDNFDFILKK
jgi:hypothetical protein